MKTNQKSPVGRGENGNRRSLEEVKLVLMDDIRLSPENDSVYRPVDTRDPDLKALSASIRKHGVVEPLVLTRHELPISRPGDLVAYRWPARRI